MQIVIDIPKGCYETICDGFLNECINFVTEAIKNGIPLPKGHGRLIDAESMKRIDAIQRGNFNSIESIRAWIGIMPTVVEADEESEDKEAENDIQSN